MAKSGSPDAFLARIRALTENDEKRQALLADSECLNGMCILLDNSQYSSALLSVFIQLADTVVDENANYGACELSKCTSLRTKVEALRLSAQPEIAEKATALSDRLQSVRASHRLDQQPHLAMRVNSPDVFSPFSVANKVQRETPSDFSMARPVGGRAVQPQKKVAEADKSVLQNSPSVKFISVASASTRSIILQLAEAPAPELSGDIDRSMIGSSPSTNDVERAKQAVLRVRGVVSIQTDSRRRRLTVRLSRELHVARLASAIRVQTGLDVCQVLRAANGVDEELVPFDRLSAAADGSNDPRYLDDSDLFNANESEAGRTALEEYGSAIKETTAVWLGKAVSFLSNAFW